MEKEEYGAREFIRECIEAWHSGDKDERKMVAPILAKAFITDKHEAEAHQTVRIEGLDSGLARMGIAGYVDTTLVLPAQLTIEGLEPSPMRNQLMAAPALAATTCRGCDHAPHTDACLLCMCVVST